MPLNSSGAATFLIPANTLNINVGFPASDTLTASYQGDSNYAQATATKTLTVSQSVFSLTGTGPASPVTHGTSGTASVAVSSSSNYTSISPVTFTSASCVLTGYSNGASATNPDNPTCTLAALPAGNGTITFANGVATGSPVAFAIHTYSATSLSAELRRPVIDHNAPAAQLAKITAPANPHAPASKGTELFGAAGGAALAALLLFFIPGGARKWSKMLGAILLIVALTFAIEGCGGGSSGGGGTTTPTLPTPTVTVTPASLTPAFNTALNVTVAVAGSGRHAHRWRNLSQGARSPGKMLRSQTAIATFTIPASTFCRVAAASPSQPVIRATPLTTPAQEQRQSPWTTFPPLRAPTPSP